MWLGSEFWSAIIGAIVGAAVSAIPAWLLARKAASDAATLEKDRQKREDRLAGTRLFLAISHVANDVFSARKQIEEMLISRPAPEAHGGQIHKRLSVLSGAPCEPIHPFAHLDLAVIADSEGVELVNSIEFLGRCYQSQCSLFGEYRIQKQRLFEVYEKAKERSAGSVDGLANYKLGAEHEVMLAEREATTEAIARGLVDILYDNSQLAYKVAALYDQLVQGHLSYLDLPRIELSSVVDKFPDVIEGGKTTS